MSDQVEVLTEPQKPNKPRVSAGNKFLVGIPVAYLLGDFLGSYLLAAVAPRTNTEVGASIAILWRTVCPHDPVVGLMFWCVVAWCVGGALLGGRFGLSSRTRIGALLAGAFCVYTIFQP
ncbi:hypothetical protein [Paraburkholderia rhynchosiae]|uniref:Uncharacterized protein n=1 Tax=Paraburkholderia rhynchosiae TaxID=487049 RepID=A0A2N7WU55_9BURK|nr:hypothetical protein [Paraburkholderia rhynchosiae]PMS32871.1 hypothetical protein C0Z16_04805 [Paraburkholderia rhynchosiae]CAB3645472.1 hypothetical protein LMG27174_00817 [Paraburkholderia rhynchosiae]